MLCLYRNGPNSSGVIRTRNVIALALNPLRDGPSPLELECSFAPFALGSHQGVVMKLFSAPILRPSIALLLLLAAGSALGADQTTAPARWTEAQANAW